MHSMVLPRVSREVIETMEQTFRAPEIVPETYRDKLMYEAGAQAAIAHLRRMEAGSSINGINREAV